MNDFMKSWQSGIVKVSDGMLAIHRTGGTGPQLVLSHGLTDNGLCWARVAQELASEFDIIMLDARGHGLSSRISENGEHDPAEDIAQAIEQLGLVAPAVIGHSVGALATARFANKYHGRASVVILEDPPFLPVASAAVLEDRQQAFRLHVEKFQAMTESEIAKLGRETSPTWHEDEFLAWAIAKKQTDPKAFPSNHTRWQDAIAQIVVPTLLIYGESERGGIVRPKIAEEARALNPQIKAVQIKGAGHNIRRENFSEYMTTIQTFLRHQLDAP
jgi:pimeloyl-ACP methyl ester carboxylesterase